VVALALLASACGGTNEPAAIDNRASEPPPSANVAVPLTPSSKRPAGDGIPGISAPPPTATPAAAAEPGADEAVATLKSYFAALSNRRYGDAYRLWGNGGQASEMTEQAFADSFAKYSDYRATIGTPGRIDAGAGQRYIEIAVRVTGRMRDGTPFALEGPVTLHRTGDIDGATAEQRSWRLSASGLKPRPTT
jgi:hypothetical protein